MGSLAEDPWELSESEISRVLRLSSDDRYAYTVNAIREHGELWCLRDDDGWCLGVDPDGNLTFPIWPHPAFARENATEEWANYYPESLPLEDFLSNAAQPIADDEYALAVLPTGEKWVQVPFTHFRAHVTGPRRSRYDPPTEGAA